MTISVEVLIAGAGFAGSLLARILARQGRRVLLVEKGRHPRFALGESSTPLANFALERLAVRWRLPDLHSLATHGRWSRDLPQLCRGLKRGFTFYRHEAGKALQESWNFAVGEGRLLVAASPSDELADTHWLREDVDHFLLQRAIEAGVDYWPGVEVQAVQVDAQAVRLEGRRVDGRAALGGCVDVRTEFLIDATGPGGLSTLLPGLALLEGAENADCPSTDRPSTLLLYSHFAGVRDTVDVLREAGVDLTSSAFPAAPYPDDRAAVHHILDEGWMYVLPFDVAHPAGSSDAGERITSAGIVLRREADPELTRLALEQPEQAWTRVVGRYPTLQAIFEGATPIRPVAVRPTLRHRLTHPIDDAHGRWLLLPHAYAFFDPLFSTGLAWSLLGVERIADLFASAEAVPTRAGLVRYAELLDVEADHVDRLITGAYRAMGDFDLIAAHAQLYFAAASFQELRQRLVGSAEAASAGLGWEGFLGATDPISRAFVEEGEERLRDAARGEGLTQDFAAWVARAIRERNVAGLADPTRRNLYPVDFDVLLRDGHRLGLDRAQLEAALPGLRGGLPMLRGGQVGSP